MTEAEFHQMLITMTGDDPKELSARLRHQIDHMARRIEYAEGRRAFFLTSAGALFAAGIAILSIAFTRPVWPPIACVFWTLGLSFPVLAIVIWLVHSAHVNFAYPFTDVAKVPKWFYRYAIQDWKKYTFPWIRSISNTERMADRSKFENDYLSFLEASKSNLLDTSSTLLEDIKQIYLLHVNEMYKNRFLTSLRVTFSRGIKTVAVLGLCSFLLGAFLEFRRWPAHDSRQQLGLDTQSVWAPTQATASTSGNVNIQLHNAGNHIVEIRGISFTNEYGMSLPYELTQTDVALPIQLEPGSSRTLSMLIELRGNPLSSVRSVVLRH